MIQFLNNIWITLSSENMKLINSLMVPACIIESYLFMNFILILFNVKVSKSQKILYTLCMSIMGTISLYIIPEPINIITNYGCILLLISFIFKLNLFKSLLALIVSVFIFVLLNILLQNPYITILNISFDKFMCTPIYRIIYLTILYLFFWSIGLFLKHFKYIKFNLELLDNLDSRTKFLIFINLLVGFLTLCIQLITTTFYIDIVPITISILNFILLISFLMLSIYSFTRIIKLANTKKDLECAEDHNKTLEILHDKVKCFQHDFANIVSTLDGFIENNDMHGLKNYFNEVKKDYQITNNLSILNPRIINNPGIYSLLNNKYFKATNLGISFDIEYFLDFNTIDVNLYELSRILGIIIDNAIEEAEKCDSKIVKLSFLRETRNNRAIITVQNTYSNKNVDIEKIFDKGESGKNQHSGIGLWEVKNYIKKSRNLDLYTSKNDKFFKQELSIYDIQKK